MDPSAACWEMLGQIGTGAPFAVGYGITFTSSTGGRLYLGVNDNYFGDNSGAWSATVTVTTPPPAPTSADDCKDGGWQNYPGLGFKNQGDCVSFVQTGGKNPPSGTGN